MTAGKLGWHWTAKGWKRTPKHLKTVKKIAKPPTRKTRKMERVAAAKVEDVPTFQQARKLAAANRRGSIRGRCFKGCPAASAWTL